MKVIATIQQSILCIINILFCIALSCSAFSAVAQDEHVDKSVITAPPSKVVLKISPLTTKKSDDEISEQQIIDDSFSDLDIEFILRDNNTNRSIDLDKEKKNIADQVVNTRDTKSVGINGMEEAIINKLDKSNLMDFNKNTDIWSEEALAKKDTDNSEIDIDELTEDHIELDDNQLIDEINGIE
jgi:hypothetical protein